MSDIERFIGLTLILLVLISFFGVVVILGAIKRLKIELDDHKKRLHWLSDGITRLVNRDEGTRARLNTIVDYFVTKYETVASVDEEIEGPTPYEKAAYLLFYEAFTNFKKPVTVFLGRSNDIVVVKHKDAIKFVKVKLIEDGLHQYYNLVDIHTNEQYVFNQYSDWEIYETNELYNLVTGGNFS